MGSVGVGIVGVGSMGVRSTGVGSTGAGSMGAGSTGAGSTGYGEHVCACSALTDAAEHVLCAQMGQSLNASFLKKIFLFLKIGLPSSWWPLLVDPLLSLLFQRKARKDGLCRFQSGHIWKNGLF